VYTTVVVCNKGKRDLTREGTLEGISGCLVSGIASPLSMEEEAKGSPPAGKKNLSIMDQRRLEEEAERKEIAREFAHPRWEITWAEEYPPTFDKLCPAPILQKMVSDGVLPNGRCLVPGCGRGYDVIEIASATRYCLGVDIAPIAISQAKERLEQQYEMAVRLEVAAKPPLNQAEFKLQSFFDIDTQHPESLFDFVYDYCLLSALDPRNHKDGAAKMTTLVRVGGELCTVIFPIMEKVGGPPFSVTIAHVRELLVPLGFEIIELRILTPELCHPGRDGAEGNNTPRTALGRWRRIKDEEADIY